MSQNNISRRKFLGQASCAAVGSTTFFSTISNLLLANQMVTPSSDPNDYKALVCILLAGGNDSFNMLMPRGNDEYKEYATTRSNLAIPQNNILPLNPINNIGKSLGVHPSMKGVQQMFEQGDLAFISNVGTLIEPVDNKTQLKNKTKRIPLGLYSHSDQIEQWQTATPHSRESLGWGGKMADILKTMNNQHSVSMNISLAGRNVFQSGRTIMEYSIDAKGNGIEGVEPINKWMSNSGLINKLRNDAVNDLTSDMYSNVFQANFAEIANASFESMEMFRNALNSVDAFNTRFSNHKLSKNLEVTAKTISANNILGMRRQTFFLTFGGWDHHDEVLNNQTAMLGVVSNAISEFFSALKEIGLQDKVTLFTISDFARTLTSNGNGSDHAWGGNAIVAGGAVNGKRIYGQYPDLYVPDNPLMASKRGNLIPTTAADQYFAELALWFGISPNDLSLIFPNIRNFYSPSSSAMPLGFLG